MAQFGATCPDLLENIQVLLARCQMDSDDEVRDRATYYNSIFREQDRSLCSTYIIDPLQVNILKKSRLSHSHSKQKIFKSILSKN